MSSQEEITNESTSGSNSKDAMFEPKPKPKMIRVLTVLAYVLSVSMAAILLSIYYIFMWDGRPQIGARTSIDSDGNSYAVPQYSTHISEGEFDDLLNNTSNFFNENDNIDDHLSSIDALRMTNETDEQNQTESEMFIGAKNYTLSPEDTPETELQQHITAIEAENLAENYMVTSPPAPTTTEESVTWSDDYEALNDLKKNGNFIKKLMNNKYYGVY